MKVELHLHTSRYSACGAATPEALMAELIAKGYQAVYITEHDAVWPDEELAELREAFPRLRIFPGVELSLRTEPLQHLLVLGTNDPGYLELIEDVPAVLDKARREDHLTVLAHPQRWPGADGMLRRGQRPDALEIRTCNQDGQQGTVAAWVAREHGLAQVNAGDTHNLDFLHRFWIETHEPLQHPDDIRRIVLAGAYTRHARE